MTSTMLKPPAPPAGALDGEGGIQENKKFEPSMSSDTAVDRGRQDQEVVDSAHV